MPSSYKIIIVAVVLLCAFCVLAWCQPAYQWFATH